jgi:hypothetical protein
MYFETSDLSTPEYLYSCSLGSMRCRIYTMVNSSLRELWCENLLENTIGTSTSVEEKKAEVSAQKGVWVVVECRNVVVESWSNVAMRSQNKATSLELFGKHVADVSACASQGTLKRSILVQNTILSGTKVIVNVVQCRGGYLSIPNAEASPPLSCDMMRYVQAHVQCATQVPP